MDNEIAISLKSVSKCFKQYARPVDRLKEILLPGERAGNEFWALRDINLEVSRGETLGVIGQNGSGKSTLLQIIAGTLTPTNGDIQVKGRVSALLELGSGFNPEFTGRQNVFFNGQLLGLSREEIEGRFDDIASFADIGNFLDQPVKTYSSGMFVRLAFAVAINVEPEVLIVDEALSVGDGVFVHRCMAKIKDFQDSGGTILFVSHDTSAITRLCSKVIWIDSGSLVTQGGPEQVSKKYQAWLYERINSYQKKEIETINYCDDKIQVAGVELSSLMKKSLNPFTEREYKAFQKVDRFGTGRGEIIDFEILDSNNSSTRFIYAGERIRIRVKALSHDLINRPIIGVLVFDRLRTAITGFNTYQFQQKLSKLIPNEILSVEFSFEWPEIRGDSYALEVAIADGSQESHEMLDWLQSPLSVASGITDSSPAFGLLRLVNIEISHNTCRNDLIPEL
jgi:lipopolysaccharide transport system ATP-binding protein